MGTNVNKQTNLLGYPMAETDVSSTCRPCPKDNVKSGRANRRGPIDKRRACDIETMRKDSEGRGRLTMTMLVWLTIL